MSPTSDPLGQVIRAAAFAAWKHRGQRRKDVAASPYINHPIALVDLLANEGGVNDPVVLCAALLHDTLEDTETTAAEIEAAFGRRIADVVLEVTDNKSVSRSMRKQLQVEHAPYASREAQLVKLADKICNLQDILAAPPAGWSTRRRREYVEWSGRVVEGLRGVHPGLEAIFDRLYARLPELA